MDFKKIAYQHRELVSHLRRDLHRIPEIALEEEKTADFVSNFLKETGFHVETGIAGHGILAHLKGGSAGKTLMIRADMDALPVQEKTGLSFASLHDGLMHACGHDAHMSMVLTTARILSGIGDQLKGSVKFLFQPAEEGPGGALPMIETGVMENPRVDYTVGCHVWPGIPAGNIGVRPGVMMAAMDRFEIRILGKSGHGAMPHLCIDAIDVACQVVNSLQRVVSRQTDPICPALLTVGSFHAGNAFNVIPEKADLCGTTRTFDRDLWQYFPEQIEKIVRGVCESMGASYELNYIKGYPPLVNDPQMVDVVRRVSESVVGKNGVVEVEPTMGGEDMAYFLERSKGCFFFLGVGHPRCAPLHSSKFDFSEEVLSLGVETFCRIAWELLR